MIKKDSSSRTPSQKGVQPLPLPRSQMLEQERLELLVELKLVFFVQKVMSLVFLNEVGHFNPTIAQSLHDLIGLLNVHSGILGALHHHQRRFDAIGVKHG